MRKIQWDNFKSDGEILEYLKRLPRYKNTMIKSAFRRGLFFLNLLYCRLLKLNKPLFVVLVTNNKCNLDCTYCYGNYGERKEYEDYSTRQLLKIIDELKIMGTRLLTVHGGESLLRKDIGEILNYIKKKGFYVGFNTNGYLVPSKIEDLKCVDTVCVSLDGKKANNDINRGKGCFDKVMKAMDVIRQNKIPLVVSATLTKENINDMEFLAELGSKKGCRIQYSILYNYSNIQKRLSNIALDDKEIRETTRKIRELRRNGYPIYYSDNVLTATIDWPISHEKSYLTKEGDELAIKKFKFVPCYHGKFKFFSST